MEIKVGLYGMDNRSIEKMLTIFKMIYKGQCVATEIQNADTVIVDLDGHDSPIAWNEFRKEFPDKPAIIMSERPVDIAGVPFVQKPAKLPDLLELLKKTSNKEIQANLHVGSENRAHRVADSLHERLAQNSPAGSIRSSSGSTGVDIYYNPDKFVQGKVFQAIKRANSEKRTIFLRCWSDRWVVISPGIDYLFENIKEGQLRQLSLVKLDEDMAVSEEPLSDKQLAEMSNTPPNEIKSTPMYKFMWDIAVRTARGRIPEGTSVDDLYVLNRWPNLTRLSRIPNSMRISAFWLEQPQSIKSVSEKLGIDIKDVFTFFSAASASGLLVIAKRREDKIIVPQAIPEEKKKRGIISAIMRKIGGLSAADENAA